MFSVECSIFCVKKEVQKYFDLSVYSLFCLKLKSCFLSFLNKDFKADRRFLLKICFWLDNKLWRLK